MENERVEREEIMLHYSEEQLKESIHEDYGFEPGLIKNPKLVGLWYIQFEVNGICYTGSMPFSGAVPQLVVDGYTSEYRDYGTPVTEQYYQENIAGKKVILLYYAEPDWVRTGKEFSSQEEAEYYIGSLENPELYDYEFVGEEK